MLRLIGISVATTGRALAAVDPLVYGAIVLFTAVIEFSAILLATCAALRGRPVNAVGAASGVSPLPAPRLIEKESLWRTSQG